MTALRLFSLAAAAGIAAGALGVYVMGSPTGNNPQPATAAIDTASTEACAAKTQRASTVGAAAQGEVAAMMAADPPRQLSNLAFNGPQGEPMSLADLHGKVTLVNLWATWCAPCRHEMPALDELQRDLGSDRFEVVAINVDTGDDEKPTAFLNEIGVGALAYYRDSTMGVFNDLRAGGLAMGLPVTLLIDEDGCLLANMNGPAEWASQDAKNLIAAAM